jgi:hypothetical protein
MDVARSPLLNIKVYSFIIITLIILLSVPAGAAQNLLTNGDFSEGSGNQPAAWKTEAWMDLDSTAFTWIPPFGNDPGEVEISNAKLNDSRWIQSRTLNPGLYYAGVQIFTSAVPLQSWAGALISIGDQGISSIDVKGSTNWTERGVFFRVSRPNTNVEVKLRLAGFKNFAVGQAFFRNAVLYKIDSAPKGAMILELDADQRLWTGRSWTLIPIFVLLGAAVFLGWRMLELPPDPRKPVR